MLLWLRFNGEIRCLPWSDPPVANWFCRAGIWSIGSGRGTANSGKSFHWNRSCLWRWRMCSYLHYPAIRQFGIDICIGGEMWLNLRLRQRFNDNARRHGKHIHFCDVFECTQCFEGFWLWGHCVHHDVEMDWKKRWAFLCVKVKNTLRFPSAILAVKWKRNS